MTFRHLEAFLEVAVRGGFTRAAEALYLTQPTVSGQIRELEDELGVALFHRLPRSVEPTEAGRLLLPLAREALASRERIEEQAAAYRGLLWGRLAVCASTIPGEYLLPAVLARFKKRHPGLRVCLGVRASAEVLRLVARGEVPLGVVGERDDTLGLRCEPLWSDRIGLYAGGALAVAAPLPLEDLARVPLVHREEGSGTRKAVETALRSAGVDPEGLDLVAEFGSTAAVKEAVKAGIGAAFLSSAAVSCEVTGGLVRPVAVAGLEAVERRFYAVWDPQRVLPPAAAAFLALLLEEARDP